LVPSGSLFETLIGFGSFSHKSFNMIAGQMPQGHIAFCHLLKMHRHHILPILCKISFFGPVLLAGIVFIQNTFSLLRYLCITSAYYPSAGAVNAIWQNSMAAFAVKVCILGSTFSLL
jgi:hypothetical protein